MQVIVDYVYKQTVIMFEGNVAHDTQKVLLYFENISC